MRNRFVGGILRDVIGCGGATGELAAAGITDPELRAAYQHCRVLNARHGRTYFLATRLLEPGRRPAVHALYGFARYADDIVDTTSDADAAAVRLEDLSTTLRQGWAAGTSTQPLVAAVVHTMRRHHIRQSLLEEFLGAMTADLTVTDYPDRAALYRYVRGSADVIGLMMLPVLGCVAPIAEAAPAAAALGRAFQLTNFCRDVGEDLDRGRIYLPADELAACGVDRERLTWCRDNVRTDEKVRAALIDQLARTREVYREARPGIAQLDPRARPCIETATHLYSEILNRIEAIDFAVFTDRARVRLPRKLQVSVPAWARARRARRRLGPR